ncbi:MAG: HAMP domain-containing protein [Chthoniobacter sp.]|nr:HAMP domain-containing protein [Chthoniobacter sp.]
MRLPLSLKILAWFFANVVFLAVVAWIFVRAQLGLGLEVLLAGAPGERLQAMGQLVADELKERPQSAWPAILARQAAAYRVSVAVFRNDGKLITGEIPPPPAELLARITEFPRPQRQPGDGPPPDPRMNRPPQDQHFPDGPSQDQRPPLDPPGQRPPREPRSGERPPQDPQGPPAIGGGFPRFLVRAGEPRRYWIGVRLPLLDRAVRPPQPTTLVLATDSLRGGGLFFDFTPWLVGGAVVLALSVLLWLPLVRGITRALRQMTGAAEDIAQGRFETHVESTRSDELGRLATALNDMAARLREFFTGQKRFLGDIAHELCSPLARMEMALGILEQRAADDDARGYVADVREETRHMAALVGELLSFSKAGVGGRSVELQTVPLAALVARLVARETREHGGIFLDVPAETAVLAEPDLLSRAIGNVIRNAVRYAAPVGITGEGAHSFRPLQHADGRPAGPIVVAARSSGAQVIVTVTDSGPGVPEAALHRLFDPFFRPEAARTRETGGAGLGLAIVKSCVEACGGTVTARNVQPSGLQVEFTLQRAPG